MSRGLLLGTFLRVERVPVLPSPTTTTLGCETGDCGIPFGAWTVRLGVGTDGESEEGGEVGRTVPPEELCLSGQDGGI